MIDQKEDKGNFLGTILTSVLFLFLISFLPGKPLLQTSCSYHYALNSEFSLNHSKAVVIDAIPMPSAQSSCLHIVYNENITLFSEANKVIADNRKTNQQFISRQKAEQLIKPSLPDRFCYQPVPTDSQDFPILG